MDQNGEKNEIETVDPMDFMVESVSSKRKRLSIILRVVGFILLITALAMMMFWQKAFPVPFFKMLSFGIAIVGFIVYMAGRILAFLANKESSRS